MVPSRELLLVEDDSVTRELLTLLLTGEGWRVHAAETGEEALVWLDGLFETQADADRPSSDHIVTELGSTEAGAMPDVVLCDQRLPGICGVALAREVQARLAALGDGGRTVVLAMSATVTAQKLEGYDGFLSKPFAASAVERLWREVLLRSEHQPGRQDGSDSFKSRGGALAPGALAGTFQDIPVLDEAVFAKLQSSMGGPALKSLYAFALADAGDRVRRMDEAYTAADGPKYVEEAHALKGSSGMIGAVRLRVIAADAERAGLDEDGPMETGSDPAHPFSDLRPESGLLSTKKGASAGVEPGEEAAVMRSKQIRSAIAEIRLMLEALFPL